MAKEKYFPIHKLKSLVEVTFQAAGVSHEEATRIADNLIEADLYGHSSHGITLVPTYIDDLEHGRAISDQKAMIVTDQGPMIGLNGCKGFGQSIGIEAMDLGIERAQKYGVSIVGLANTHHLGRIGHWGERCARAGFASIHFVNVIASPKVAPWGGTDARLVTNPFCVTVPHQPYPIVLDYATSSIAFGKLRVAYEAEKQLAPGLLLDGQGKPTTDPAVMFEDPVGALLPFGEHKGYALAFMCELLGGALSGGMVQDHAPIDNPLINNMFSIIFDPYKLTSKEKFDKQVANLMDWLKASPPMKEDQPVQFPGDPEQTTRTKRSEEGVPLAPGSLQALLDCAENVGIENPGEMLQ